MAFDTGMAAEVLDFRDRLADALRDSVISYIGEVDGVTDNEYNQMAENLIYGDWINLDKA